jgi:hypothetical protein
MRERERERERERGRERREEKKAKHPSTRSEDWIERDSAAEHRYAKNTNSTYIHDTSPY